MARRVRPLRPVSYSMDEQSPKAARKDIGRNGARAEKVLALVSRLCCLPVTPFRGYNGLTLRLLTASLGRRRRLRRERPFKILGRSKDTFDSASRPRRLLPRNNKIVCPSRPPRSRLPQHIRRRVVTQVPPNARPKVSLRRRCQPRP